MNNKHKLWVEKYRPIELEDYVFYNKAMEEPIRAMIKDKTIPHLLFSGTAGSGKTTLAFIIINALDMDPSDVLTLNATGKEFGGVDFMRESVQSFISTHSFGDFKIVHLEEADYLTHTAQAQMRRMMEEFSDHARFILTCNYDNKIIPAIRSRCQHFHFRRPDFNELLEYIYTRVLVKEKVKADFETLERYVTIGFPDTRKIINLVQQNTIDGKLVDGGGESSTDWEETLLNMIGRDEWEEARNMAYRSVADEEWEDVYRILYQNLAKAGKFKDKKKWEEGVIVIAEHLYKHGITAIPSINGTAMFIKLAMI